MMRYGAGLLVLLLLASGCASPPARFYKLSAAAPPAAAPVAVSVAVAVGPVSIPAIVDRPQFVLRTGPNEVRVDEFNRWGAPLADDIARVVAENLVVMLGTPYVTLYAQQTGEPADFRVALGVQRFESSLGEAALLDAVWTVRRTKDGTTRNGRTTVREPTQRQGFDALAAAHSRAVARLSEDIAEAVRVQATSQP